MNDRKAIPAGPQFEKVMGIICLSLALLGTYFVLIRPVFNALQGKSPLIFREILAFIPLFYVLGLLFLIRGPDSKRVLSMFDKPPSLFAWIVIVLFILFSILFAYLPDLLIDLLQ